MADQVRTAPVGGTFGSSGGLRVGDVSEQRQHRVGPGLLVSLVGVVLGVYLAVDRLVEVGLPELTPVTGVVVEATAMALSSAAALWVCVLWPWARRERTAEAARWDILQRDRARDAFAGRLARALDISATEEACYDVVALAFDQGVPRLHADLMLADSSDAHLKTVVAGAGPTAQTGPTGGCAVVSPQNCPAVRRAQPQIFASSTDLDACPHLRSRGVGTLSAACVPVAVAGRSIGVIHATTTEATAPIEDEVAALTVIADQVGTQVGMLRVLAQTTLQAATDPLTGLMNRRTLENRVRELIRRDQPLAIAFADLDHFKHINDVYGHDVGDRVLRAYSRTLNGVLRTEDLVARYGGEEFVAVLPNVTAEQATQALARIGPELAATLAASGLPAVTATYGLADSTDGASFEQILAAADHALLDGKRAGRDRITTAHPPHAAQTSPSEPDPS